MRTKIKANHQASKIAASLVCTIGAKQTCIGKDFAESLWLPSHIFALRISTDGSTTVSGYKCLLRVQDGNQRNATNLTFRRPQSCAPIGLTPHIRQTFHPCFFGEGQSQSEVHDKGFLILTISDEHNLNHSTANRFCTTRRFVTRTGGKVDNNAHKGQRSGSPSCQGDFGRNFPFFSSSLSSKVRQNRPYSNYWSNKKEGNGKEKMFWCCDDVVMHLCVQ